MENALASIIINNYNYGKYIRSAIDSALGQTYKNIEVIVVDDGSTDESHGFIRDYGDRIKSILKPNGGQASAYNVGFAASYGEYTIFLDADDVLHKDAIYCSIDKFRDDNVVKVQFRLEIIDDGGKHFGVHIPAGRMPNGDVLGFLLKYGSYGSPPASGNVYRRSVLSKIMPIPESDWRIAADSVPSLASPFFGDVRSIDKVLGYYRVHGSIGGGRQSSDLLRPGNVASLRGKAEEFIKAEKYLKELCVKQHKNMQENVVYKNPSVLKTLLSYKILEPNHIYNKGYNVINIVSMGITASIRYPLYSVFHKLAIASWFILVAICPIPIKKNLIRLALQPAVRGRNIK